MKNAFLQWKEMRENQQVKENGADFVITKIRRRMLRKGFDRYKAAVLSRRKDDRDEDRVEYLKNALTERLKRKIYD